MATNIRILYDVQKKKIELTEKALRKLDKTTALTKKEVGRINKKFKDQEKQLTKTTGAFGKIQGAIAPLAGLIAGAFVTTALVSFAKSAAKVAIEMEQLEVAFTTFLGSAKKAKDVLAELTKFSLSTPFTPDQVFLAGKALLAFGIEAKKLIPTLKSIGDTSAATGKDFNELAIIFGKARVAGVLMAEDINQLTEAGVPIIDEFAKLMGASADQVKKLGSEGKITFDLLDQAFINMTSEGGRFFDLMIKQSATTGGKLSTLEGSFTDLQLALGQFATSEGAKATIEFFNTLLVSVTDTIRLISRVSKENRLEEINQQAAFATAALKEAIKRNAPEELIDSIRTSLVALKEEFNILAEITEEGTGGEKPGGGESPLIIKTKAEIAALRELEKILQQIRDQAATDAETRAQGGIGFNIAEIEATIEDERVDVAEDGVDRRRKIKDAELQGDIDRLAVRQEIANIEIAMVGSVIGAFSQLAKDGSEAQIALLLLEKGIAIGRILTNLAAEKSLIALTAAQINLVPPFVGGIAYAAIQVPLAVARATGNIGQVLAQAVPELVGSFHEGGEIKGAFRHGDVAINAQEGEFMIKTKAVDHYGLQAMESINNMEFNTVGFSDDNIVAAIDNMNRSFANRPVHKLILDNKGYRDYVIQGTNETRYVKSRYV